MYGNRYGHNLSSRFNVGEPFDEKKIGLPVDSIEKDRVERYLTQLNGDVSKLVGTVLSKKKSSLNQPHS